MTDPSIADQVEHALAHELPELAASDPFIESLYQDQDARDALRTYLAVEFEKRADPDYERQTYVWDND